MLPFRSHYFNSIVSCWFGDSKKNLRQTRTSLGLESRCSVMMKSIVSKHRDRCRIMELIPYVFILELVVTNIDSILTGFKYEFFLSSSSRFENLCCGSCRYGHNSLTSKTVVQSFSEAFTIIDRPIICTSSITLVGRCLDTTLFILTLLRDSSPRLVLDCLKFFLDSPNQHDTIE
jgi:hypothetical protein